jgi:hypothetical protein
MDFLTRFKPLVSRHNPSLRSDGLALRRKALRHPRNQQSCRSRQVAACTFEVPKDSLSRLFGVDSGDGREEHCGGRGETEVMFGKDRGRFCAVGLGGHDGAFATGDGGDGSAWDRSRGGGGGESSPVWSPTRPDLEIIATVITVVNGETDSPFDTRSCGLEFQPVLNFLELPARPSRPNLTDGEAGHYTRVEPSGNQFGNGYWFFFAIRLRSLHPGSS